MSLNARLEDAGVWLRRATGRWRVVQLRAGVGSGLKFCRGASHAQFAAGTNELPVQQAVAELLKPGQVFYDVGANVGFFSVIAARLTGPQGHVVAFEPVATNCALVRYNCRLNSLRNVELIEDAVGDVAGTGNLLLARYSGGAALDVASAPPDFAGKVSVRVVTLDDLVSQQRIAAPDVVKIDVEGAEIHVLRGMRRVLTERRPVVIFEVDAADKAGVDAKWNECVGFLQRLGYGIRELADSYADIKWCVRHGVAVFKSGG